MVRAQSWVVITVEQGGSGDEKPQLSPRAMLEATGLGGPWAACPQGHRVYSGYGRANHQHTLALGDRESLDRPSPESHLDCGRCVGLPPSQGWLSYRLKSQEVGAKGLSRPEMPLHHQEALGGCRTHSRARGGQRLKSGLRLFQKGAVGGEGLEHW